MTDPYQVLGVRQDCSDDELKKAYRNLCKKYHPDMNPGDALAEARFKDVQAAYDRVTRRRQGREEEPTATYRRPQEGYSPFGGFGYNPFEQAYARQRQQYAENESSNMHAARSYINAQHYPEALAALAREAERDAKWYYFSAVANTGLSNYATARQQAAQACSMQPNNLEYQRFYSRLQQQQPMAQAANGRSILSPFLNIGKAFMVYMVLQLLFRFLFFR